MIAWITKIPWAWSFIGGFTTGWLGGWPGEVEEAEPSAMNTLFSIGLVLLGGIIGVWALRELTEDK